MCVCVCVWVVWWSGPCGGCGVCQTMFTFLFFPKVFPDRSVLYGSHSPVLAWHVIPPALDIFFLFFGVLFLQTHTRVTIRLHSPSLSPLSRATGGWPKTTEGVVLSHSGGVFFFEIFFFEEHHAQELQEWWEGISIVSPLCCISWLRGDCYLRGVWGDYYLRGGGHETRCHVRCTRWYWPRAGQTDWNCWLEVKPHSPLAQVLEGRAEVEPVKHWGAHHQQRYQQCQNMTKQLQTRETVEQISS